jgi:glycosyltransferase involved in cell wall biosynthesis
MKIALVHELLTMRGGAERVLKIAADLFPEAPIYTLLYDEKKLGDWFPKNRVRTSTLQPYAKFSTDHHLYLKHFPAAVEAWDFSEFDVVLSFSSAFAHGILTNGKPKHVCYVHSPARYLWDRTHDVLDSASNGLLGSLKRWHLSRTFHNLRIWDTEAADRPDVLLAASKEVQRRIQLYWRRDSQIVYPPIGDEWLQPRTPSTGAMQNPDYFLVVSTLARYKRIDLAIEACNKTGAHLKIVGEGPDMARLKALAGPTVEFYGWRKNDELADLYARAKAVLFAGHEDFGLVPLEAMSCGTPVIAFGQGGATETVLPGKTGTFFSEATADALAEVLKNFDRAKFDPAACKAQAKTFDRATFEKGIRSAIERVL